MVLLYIVTVESCIFLDVYGNWMIAKKVDFSKLPIRQWT